MTAINNYPGKSGSSAKKSSGAKSSSPASGPVLNSDLFKFTIQARTGQIVKIESVDSTGAHHELSDEEKTNQAKEKGKATLEDMLKQAFEAGIACVLGEAAGEDDPTESAKHADLRRLLLRPLIEDGAAKRLMQRNILSRAMLATLIRD